MSYAKYNVKPMTKEDIPFILNYWDNLSPAELKNMGVDINLKLDIHDLNLVLENSIMDDFQKKKAYYVIWRYENRALGYSNINQIKFARSAFMHLHLWSANDRKKGFSSHFILQSLSFFFKNLELKELFCQPYSLNPAPHGALKKAGFDFVKEYETIPGPINFRQKVKQWKISKKKLALLNKVPIKY